MTQIVKDEVTMRLDDVTKQADEALIMYGDLIDQIEDPELRAKVSATIREQRSALQQLMSARQAHAETPQVGNVERGHVLALIASITKRLGASDASVIQKIVEANVGMRDAARAADDCDLPYDEREAIARIIASCESLHALLHPHARQS